MKRWRGLYLAAAMAALFGAAPPAVAQTVVTVGSVGLLPDSPMYIGVAKGYFQEQGLEIKFVEFASGAQMAAPLATGDLQVAGGGIGVSLFNAILRDHPIVVVSDRAYLVPGYDGTYWMVRADLKETIKGVPDLRGRTVAINTLASPVVYQVGKTLDKFGLDHKKDIRMVTIPFPDMRVAFQNKAIDVAIVVEPFVTQVAASGVAAKWMATSQILTDPYVQIGATVFNKTWARQNPDVAKRFMAAWLKAAREYIQAMRGGPNRTEVIRILSQRLRVKDPALIDRMEWFGLGEDGRAHRDSIQDQMDWYVKHGYLAQPVPLDKVIDDTYITYAVEQLRR